MTKKQAYMDLSSADPYARGYTATSTDGVSRALNDRVPAEFSDDPALKKRPIPAKPERRDSQMKLSYTSDPGKVDPADVGYDEMGGMQSRRCGKCVHFMEPNSCEVVRGAINTDGICDMFDPDTYDKTGSALDILLESFAKHASADKYMQTLFAARKRGVPGAASDLVAFGRRVGKATFRGSEKIPKDILNDYKDILNDGVSMHRQFQKIEQPVSRKIYSDKSRSGIRETIKLMRSSAERRKGR